MNMGKKKVVVAMSGGVDSSVTAALLREQGYEVIGAHIKMWSDPSIPCNFKEDRYDAMRAAEKIGIPFQTWDFTEEYRTAVVEYLIAEYAAGRTPNPDVMCNRHIKFGAFLRRALALGADYIATGHYVRLRRSLELRARSLERNYKNQVPNSKFQVLAAQDANKDQSYFLWTLTQEQLRHCLFPIGKHTKPEVRAMARKFNLPTAEKKDSQGICFIGEIDLNAFLKKHIPMRPGLIGTTAGRLVGEHEGLSFYTMGQREGLGVGGGGIPYYVAGKNFATNTLVVAEGPYDEKLFSREIAVGDINWISGKTPHLPLRCEARIRYRQSLQKCTILQVPNSAPSANSRASPVRSQGIGSGPKFQVRFHEPQRAATPGQSVVFYKNEEMLGGGIIIA